MSDTFLRLLRLSPKLRTEDPETDEQLISRIRDGDQSAWAAFLERYTDLIYRKAWEFSRAGHTHQAPEDLEDEMADLYLFMAAYLKQSLRSFRGECKPGTWVMSILQNRRRVLKAYLLRKAPGRADVRLPRVMTSRPEMDREIFRRLVWGLDTAYIAQSLNIPEALCWEIEDLLAAHSPRVYGRIQANRTAREPVVSIDALVERDEGQKTLLVQVADPGSDPEQNLEEQESEALIQNALLEGAKALSVQERRILILLYNEGVMASEIVRLAASDKNMGLPTNLNRVYYLKDRALGKILDRTIAYLPGGQQILSATRKRDLFRKLEEVLQERGIPVQKSPSS